MSKEDKNFFFDCTHGIVAVQGNSVVHLCSYLDPPTEKQYWDLYDELQTDEELGLVGEDFELHYCPDDLFQEIMQDAKTKTQDGNINWIESKANG